MVHGNPWDTFYMEITQPFAVQDIIVGMRREPLFLQKLDLILGRFPFSMLVHDLELKKHAESQHKNKKRENRSFMFMLQIKTSKIQKMQVAASNNLSFHLLLLGMRFPIPFKNLP